MSGLTVRVFDDAASVAREAAALFVSSASAARAAGRRRFAALLAAGPASCLAWAALAAPELAAQVDWEDVRVFPAEERHGAYTHPDSSYRKLYLALGSRVPLAPGALGRLWGEGDDPAVIAGYGDVQLRHVVGCGGSAVPRFDLVALEVGPGGRISGLKPGSPSLAEPGHLVAFDRDDVTGEASFTIAPAVIAAAETLIVLATGPEIAASVPAVLSSASHGRAVALRAVRPGGRTTVVLADRAAASRL